VNGNGTPAATTYLPQVNCAESEMVARARARSGAQTASVGRYIAGLLLFEPQSGGQAQAVDGSRAGSSLQLDGHTIVTKLTHCVDAFLKKSGRHVLASRGTPT